MYQCITVKTVLFIALSYGKYLILSNVVVIAMIGCFHCITKFLYILSGVLESGYRKDIKEYDIGRGKGERWGGYLAAVAV
ncbi:hypothetical protein ACHAW6_000500 [Cyclotella cf. meneghiniana]